MSRLMRYQHLVFFSSFPKFSTLSNYKIQTLKFCYIFFQIFDPPYNVSDVGFFGWVSVYLTAVWYRSVLNTNKIKAVEFLESSQIFCSQFNEKDLNPQTFSP